MIVANIPSANYSLEEKVVGTWIDGKPLYQKTVIFEGLSVGSVPIEISVGNIELTNFVIRDVSGKTVVNGTDFPGTNAYFNSSTFFFVTIMGTGDVRVKGSSGWIVNGVCLTLRYTKTTD